MARMYLRSILEKMYWRGVVKKFKPEMGANIAPTGRKSNLSIRLKSKAFETNNSELTNSTVQPYQS
jgi:hypothetical protein